MTKKTEFVQLEAGEDVNSVRDRLSFIRGQRVLIVWPEEGTALPRKLDLVLIQREAMRRALRIAFVTHDPQVIQHAEELNISTFETIGASERGRWKRGRGKVFISRFQRPKDEPEPEELMEVASRVRGPSAAISTARRIVVRLVVLVVLFGVALGVAYAVVPTATIIISPAQAQIPVKTEFNASIHAAQVDVEKGIVPATTLRVEIESSGTVPTTGKQSSADVPAKGSVIFLNQTARAVDIPVGTTVGTSAGTPILFHTTQDATVEKGVGKQVEVPVEALPSAAGSAGNVESGLINTVIGPLDSKVTVRNLAPTSGGESRALPAVSQADSDRLLATVRQQIQAQAYAAMQASLSKTQFLVIETLRIAEERSDWTQFSAKPGDIADTLTLKMRAIVEGVAVDQQFAQQIAFARMAAQIPRGRVIKPNTLTYDCCAFLELTSNGDIKLQIGGSGIVIGQVNTGQLQERLAGRSLDEAMKYLLSEVDLDAGSPPQIVITPAWMDRLPVLPVRIEIRVQETP